MKIRFINLTIALALVMILGPFITGPLTAFAGDRAGGGGGSYYKGVPLEDLAQDPKKLPAYSEHIAPIMNKLAKDQSVLWLTFEMILSAKTWYFVPGPLEQLPKGSTGAPISVNDGIQHFYREVWVDTDLFNSSEMTTKRQALMIMHELLMGLKILRFDSDKFICLFLTTVPESCDGIGEAPPFHDKPLAELIKPRDYVEIRQTGRQFFNNFDSMSTDDINEMMAANHFSLRSYEFKSSKTYKQISFKDLLETIQAASLSQRLPKYSYSEDTLADLFKNWMKTSVPPSTPLLWEPSGKCSIAFTNLTPESVEVQLKVNGQPQLQLKLINPEDTNSTGARTILETSLTQDWTYSKNYEVALHDKQPLFSKDHPAPKPGDTYQSVRFSLGYATPLRLNALRFSKYVCISEGCQTWSEVEGSVYMCSTQPFITIPQDY
jgi:hypothetical protein